MRDYTRLFSIPLLFFWIPTSLLSQWNFVPTGLPYNSDGQYVSEDVVFIVGRTIWPAPDIDGYIAKSIDGGHTFTNIVEVVNGNYSAIHFLNENKGFVAGDHEGWAVILKTLNGGETWQTIQLDEFVPAFRDFYFINDDIGFLCGGFGTNVLFKTTDGGNTWNKVDVPFGTALDDVHFVNDTHGFVASKDGKIFLTTDQGNNWYAMPNLPVADRIEAIQFIHTTIGIVAFENGEVYRTQNGGKFWAKINLPGAAGIPILFRFHFMNDVVGFMVMTDDSANRLYHTTNAGQSWTEIFQTTGLSFFEFICLNPSYQTALIGGLSNLFVNTEAVDLVAPHLLFGLISGYENYCGGQPPVNLRLDFGGTPPWNTVIKTVTEQFPVNNITSTPYYFPVAPSTSKSYTLGDVVDASMNSNPGVGQAFVKVNPLPAANISGKDTICIGEYGVLTIELTGCPPLSITYSDGANETTVTDIFESVYFLEVPLLNDSVPEKEIRLISVTDGTGQVSQNVTGKGELFLSSSAVNISGYTGEQLCIQEEGIIYIELSGKPPFCVQFTDGTNAFEKCGITSSSYVLEVPAIEGTYTLTGVTNECGEGKVYDSLAIFRLKPITKSPDDLVVTMDPNSEIVQLQWNDNADNEWYYIIYRKTDGSPNFSYLDIVPDNTETFFDHDAHEGFQNSYKVRARNSQNCPADSNIDSVYLSPSFHPIIINTSGIDYYNGLAWMDINNDDLTDLFITNFGIMINQGNSVFSPLDSEDETYKKLIEGNLVSIADFDNDGFDDIYCWDNAGFSPLERDLFKNNGNNTFSKMNLPRVDGSAFSINWGDTDRDGDVDLLVSGYSSPFYRNDGNGIFTLNPNIGLPTQTRTLINSIIDFDSDGDLDILFAKGENVANDILLYKNYGNGTFMQIYDHGLENVFDSENLSWIDLNHDRFLDLLICPGNIAVEKCRAFKNLGNGQFEEFITSGLIDQTVEGLSTSDFDNNGWTDFFHTSPGLNTFYYTVDETTFSIKQNSIVCYEMEVEGSVATADINNDGYQDIAVKGKKLADNTGYHFVYENDKKYPGNWIKVKCIGSVSNRSAIGAKLFLKSQINGKTILQVHHVQTDGGNLSQSSLVQHFGLGDAEIVDSLIIEWPSGTKTYHTGLPINSYYVINEDGSGSTVGLDDHEKGFAKFNFSIQPNPVADEARIIIESSTESKAILHLIDVNGRKYETKILEDGLKMTTLDMKSYPAGIYFMQIVAGNNTAIKRFIKV